MGGYLKATYDRENHVATKESLDALERQCAEYESNIDDLEKDVEFQKKKAREMEDLASMLRRGDRPEKRSRMEPEYFSDPMMLEGEITRHQQNAANIKKHMAQERLKLSKLQGILTEMRADRAKGV